MVNLASPGWILLLALLAANIPFFTQRLFGLVRVNKTFAWRLLELLLLYFAVGALALALEQRQGQIYAQGWEFYAVTAFLFATLAFPGFVYRYLWCRP